MRSLMAIILFCVVGSPALEAQDGFELQVGSGVPPLGGEVKPERALRIVLGGDFKFTLVSRDSDVFRAAQGNGVTPTVPGQQLRPLVPSTSANSGGDVFFDPMISLNMRFELANAVSAVVQIETQHHEYVTARRAGGLFAQDRDMEVEQAYVRWERALDQPLTFQFGIQDFKKDFAKTGQPFLVDVAHSESAFANPTAAGDVGTPQSVSSGSVGLQEAAGGWGRYEIGDVHLDFFYFTLAETFRANSDDALWGASLEYEADKGGDNETGLGVIAMALNNDSSSYLWTFGGGGYTHFGTRSLKLYGEGYAQAGRYGSVAVAGQTQRRKIQQEEAWAAFGGIRYYLPGLESFDAFLDASYWEVSGDDQGGDFQNSNFVSLESNNDLIVVEDGYYGLDIDTNYRAIKVKAGFTPFRSVTVEGTYAFVELQDNSRGTVDAAVSSHDRIGNEFDINVRYRATDNLNFRVRSGWLFDAKALGIEDELNITAVEAALKF